MSSRRTEGVFVGLTVAFLGLFAVRVSMRGGGGLAWLLLVLACVFLFYSVNYRVLVIKETPSALELRFGLLSWSVSWESIEQWARDDTSLWRIGGAGIHFTPIRGRYRVFFNFLEYPRVVLNVSSRRGIVRAVAFSTQRPEEVLAVVGARVAERGAEAGSGEAHGAA